MDTKDSSTPIRKRGRPKKVITETTSCSIAKGSIVDKDQHSCTSNKTEKLSKTIIRQVLEDSITDITMIPTTSNSQLQPTSNSQLQPASILQLPSNQQGQQPPPPSQQITMNDGDRRSKTKSRDRQSKTSSRKSKKLQLELEYAKKGLELEQRMLELEKQIKLAELEESTDEEHEMGSQSEISSTKNVKMWMNSQIKDQAVEQHDQRQNVQFINEDHVKQTTSHEKVRGNISFSCKNDIANRDDHDINVRDFITRQSIPQTLPEFSGDPLEWPIFYAEFQNSTKICNFSPYENLSRLRKSLSGSAKQSVVSLLVLPQNVDTIIDILKSRYGDPIHIIRILIDKVKNFPTIRDDRPDTFIKFVDLLTNLVYTLKSLDEIDHVRNPILFDEVLSKLPISQRISFIQHYDDHSTREPKLYVLHKWLNRRMKAFNQLAMTPTHNDERSKPKPFQKPKEVTLTTTATTSKEKKFIYCQNCGSGEHRIYECEKFKKLDVDEKWNIVTQKSLCISCLGKNHTTKTCKRRKECAVDNCKRIHNKLLHKPDKDIEVKPLDNIPVQNNFHVNVVEGEVLLKVIPIQIIGPKKTISTFALLDEASTVTLIDEDLANDLELDGPTKPLKLQWTNNQTNEQSNSRLVSLTVKGCRDTSKVYTLRRVKTIAGLNLPTQRVNFDNLCEHYPFLKKFSDVSYQSAKPRLLIGQDNWPVIVSRKVIYGQWNGPVASKTLLGWVVHGNIVQSSEQPTEHIFNIYDMSSDPINDKDDLNILLHNLIKEQWKLDSDHLTKDDVKVSQDDKRCIQILDNTIKRISDKKFESGLLWKSDDPHLPDSYENAFSRLRTLENKMDKNADYAQIYCGKMDEYVKKGYIKKLNKDEASIKTPKTFYLPHFGVVNPNKPNKLRIVFDAAAKAKGYCLNDFLLTGPDNYNSLPTILMNFRINKIAYVGDVREMFLQIDIRQEDRDAQRILWRGMNRTEMPDIYEIQVVFFGAKCSPCISQEVKNRNALEFKDIYPKAFKDIVENHYMDDYLGGADNPEEALKLIQEVMSVHEKAGFFMCNWICTSKEVMDKIDADRVMASEPKIKIDSSKEERVLGLWWNYDKDQFTYHTKFHKVDSDIIDLKRKPTKREILKVIMSIFDPLGFISNILISGKIILQCVWESGIDWSEQIDDTIFEMWTKFCKQIQCLSSLQIPRKLTSFPISNLNIQLHVFCDASKYAYAACAYLRFEHEGSIECTLILSKARVAPLRQTSIPRLELQSALLGARLFKQISTSLELKINDVFLWSDSEIVLSWIKSSSKRFKVYEAHRLGEIHEISDSKNWRYVPSKLNIADDATKVKSIDFTEGSTWLNGPQFLKLPESKWPRKRIQEDIFEFLERNDFVNVTTECKIILPDASKFSKWTVYIRTVAYIKRFVNLIKVNRRRSEHSELQPEELAAAELLIYRKIQSDFYKVEIKCAEKQEKIPNNSLLRSIPFILAEDELLRLEGRLDNAEDSEIDSNAKKPILLYHKHPVTSLIIKHFHEQNSHIGLDTVVSNLRKYYWISKCRSAVKKVALDCQFCKNRKAQPQIPMIGQLPSCRVNATARAFIKTGVDLFGPFEVTVNRKHEKRYGVIFTCMVTRAVHLEIAQDLSSNAFIHCWRQFGCRRGFPEELFSDNGTNFRKSCKEINDAINNWPHDDITRIMTMKNCKWSFNPPLAPHMGGAWERLIQNVKKHLQNILNERHPKEFALRTLFCEVENMINSRPLTDLPLDSVDAEPLTPNDILIGKINTSLMFARTDDKDLYMVNMWKASQRMADIFWERWKREYRQHILMSRKWTKHNKNLQKGDVVLIIDKDGPRNTWPKGIIVETYTARDGCVRIVDVKTVNNTYRRPVSKIIKLDVKNESIQSS